MFSHSLAILPGRSPPHHRVVTAQGRGGGGAGVPEGGGHHEQASETGVGILLVEGPEGRVIVGKLMQGGPAEAAGVRVGDVIISVEGQRWGGPPAKTHAAVLL